MKLAILLTQYFYQQKELSLPGIGVFKLDKAVAVPDANDKNFTDFLQHISFVQKKILKPDDALIDYIRIHTGKIKPLAESDLESYLADGKLLLNIGKPFYLEGIGALQKNREGVFEFTPGQPLLERLSTQVNEKNTDKNDKSLNKKKPVTDDHYSPSSAAYVPPAWVKPVLIVVLGIIAIGIIIWGGYSLYDKKTEQPVANEVTIPQPGAAPVNSDSLASAAGSDSSRLSQVVGTPPGQYKFVMETANKRRALRRFAIIKPISQRMQIETTDSVTFKIYAVLPAAPADTLRIKDSLNGWYYGAKPIRVTIEQ